MDSGCLAIIASKMLSSCTATVPRRQPVQPKYLLYEYTPMVLRGKAPISERKPGTNVP